MYVCVCVYIYNYLLSVLITSYDALCPRKPESIWIFSISKEYKLWGFFLCRLNIQFYQISVLAHGSLLFYRFVCKKVIKFFKNS